MARTKLTARPKDASSKSSSGNKRVGGGTRKRRSPLGKPSKRPSPSNGQAAGIKKPHRFHPGVVAAREVKRIQKGTEILFQRAPFVRDIRMAMAKYSIGDTRIQASAIKALEEGIQDFAIKGFFSADYARRMIEPSKKTLTKGHWRTAIGCPRLWSGIEDRRCLEDQETPKKKNSKKQQQKERHADDDDAGEEEGNAYNIQAPQKKKRSPHMKRAEDGGRSSGLAQRSPNDGEANHDLL